MDNRGSKPALNRYFNSIAVKEQRVYGSSDYII